MKKTSIYKWLTWIVILAVLYIVAKTPPKSPEEIEARSKKSKQDIEAIVKKNAQQAFETELIVLNKRRVREAAKDPDSVKFKNVFFNETEENGSVVCGQFNAKNSFGAYTGYQRFIGGTSTLLLESNSNIAEVWVSACLKPAS